MRVHIPSPLHAYTHGVREVTAIGNTVDELLRDLDRQFPGLRYRMVDEQRRIRPHMRVFVNDTQTFSVDESLASSDYILIVQALSGG
jgi:sulfur-carrier protein